MKEQKEKEIKENIERIKGSKIDEKTGEEQPDGENALTSDGAKREGEHDEEENDDNGDKDGEENDDNDHDNSDDLDDMSDIFYVIDSKHKSK